MHGENTLDIVGMTLPNSSLLQDLQNWLLNEELIYDTETLAAEYNELSFGQNSEQKGAYHIIISSVKKNEGKPIFAYGHGRTGKTYLWKTVIAKLRAESEIVLTVTTSGIVALFLLGGRATHSQFHLPLDLNQHSTCDIKRGT